MFVRLYGTSWHFISANERIEIFSSTQTTLALCYAVLEGNSRISETSALPSGTSSLWTWQNFATARRLWHVSFAYETTELVRSTDHDNDQFMILSVFLYNVQHDWRDAARRAGSSVPDKTCYTMFKLRYFDLLPICCTIAGIANTRLK